MTEIKTNQIKLVKVGYYSMGLSIIFAGVVLLLEQLGYVLAGGIHILWPVMLILLGLETIISKFVVSIGKNNTELRPAWGVIIINVILVGCSHLYLMLLDFSDMIHF